MNSSSEIRKRIKDLILVLVLILNEPEKGTESSDEYLSVYENSINFLTLTSVFME